MVFKLHNQKWILKWIQEFMKKFSQKMIRGKIGLHKCKLPQDLAAPLCKKSVMMDQMQGLR